MEIENYEVKNAETGVWEPGLDLVNKPPHYLTGKIEVLDFILDQKLSYLAGQVVKYLCRAEHKGTLRQDYEKAQFYLNRLVKETNAND